MVDNVTQPPVWRLRADHYLNVANTFFIQREVDGETQEMVEHRYPVPRLISLKDSKCWNGGSEVILVSNDPAAKIINARMWIFNGEPTPDMDPQNEAAEAISAALRSKWLKPFEELHATGRGGMNFAKDLETALARVLDAASAGKATSVGGLGSDALAELKSQMAVLMKQNAELAAKVAAVEAAPQAAVGGRRA